MGKAPESVHELAKLMAEGVEPEFLFFWGHTSRSGRLGKECLSQWYPAPFQVEGTAFATAEHFMMWSKAKLFGDEDTAARILAVKQPDAAKQFGRAVKGFDEARWVSARFDIVLAGSLAKFSQNPELRAFLLSTEGKVLVEASPRDAIWGIGVAESDRVARTPAAWPGLNLLGFALMRARAALAQQESK